MVVVAVTTTGHNPDRHSVIEVAAVNTDTSQEWNVTVPVTQQALDIADNEHLRRHRYRRRKSGEGAETEMWKLRDELTGLADQLAGNTFAGAYPELTAAFLMPLLHRHGQRARWHQRMADVSALTAGAFGISPTKIPSLPLCCRLWGVDLDEDDLRTAAGNARATAACFAALERYTATDLVSPMLSPLRPATPAVALLHQRTRP